MSLKPSLAKENEPAKIKTITTYRMKPSLKESFKTAQIREIVNEVLTETLQGKRKRSENSIIFEKLFHIINIKILICYCR